MSEYIKKEDAMEPLYERWKAAESRGDDDIAEITKMDYITVSNVPSADVVEVRHGHWIYIDKVRPECPDDSDCYYECSECHAGDAHNKRVQVPYCWHCGARMDGEEE